MLFVLHLLLFTMSFCLYRYDPLLMISLYLGASCMLVFTLRARHKLTVLFTGLLMVPVLGVAGTPFGVAVLWGGVAVRELYKRNERLEYPEACPIVTSMAESLTIIIAVLWVMLTFHRITFWPLAVITWLFVAFVGNHALTKRCKNCITPKQEDSPGKRHAENVAAKITEAKTVAAKAITTKTITAKKHIVLPDSFLEEGTPAGYGKASLYLREKSHSYPASIRSSLISIADSTDKILRRMEEEPYEMDTGLRFLYHFFPSVFSLADKYTRLHHEQSEGEESLAVALEKSAAMLERLKKAFAKKYFKMLRGKISELSVEVNTLDAMLKMRGL